MLALVSWINIDYQQLQYWQFVLVLDNVNNIGGTEGYFAPERYLYDKKTGGQMSFKSDIWSLAITMCQYVCDI